MAEGEFLIRLGVTVLNSIKFDESDTKGGDLNKKY